MQDETKILIGCTILYLVGVITGLAIGLVKGKVDCLESTRLLRSVIESELSAHRVPAWTGTASYYSIRGCIGCRDDRLMANGERLDDGKMTVAFNRLPLDTWVSIRNTYTDDISYARITDTGGFESLGRIIDLSVATKEAIGCTDLCDVEVRAL